MGWVLETLFDLIWVGLLDKVGRKARPWVFALLLMGPLAAIIALLWVLV